MEVEQPGLQAAVLLCTTYMSDVLAWSYSPRLCDRSVRVVQATLEELAWSGRQKVLAQLAVGSESSDLSTVCGK